jgi:hypothetical protein
MDAFEEVRVLQRAPPWLFNRFAAKMTSRWGVKVSPHIVSPIDRLPHVDILRAHWLPGA